MIQSRIKEFRALFQESYWKLCDPAQRVDEVQVLCLLTTVPRFSCLQVHMIHMVTWHASSGKHPYDSSRGKHHGGACRDKQGALMSSAGWAFPLVIIAVHELCRTESIDGEFKLKLCRD
jgi:hypothetical protein